MTDQEKGKQQRIADMLSQRFFPPVELPQSLVSVLGPNSASIRVVFYAVVDRATTSLLHKSKKVVLLLSYTSLFLCNLHDGEVLRLIKFPELKSPLLVATDEASGEVSSILLKVTGEHDAMLQFVTPHPANHPTLSKGSLFVERLRKLHDAFVPHAPLELQYAASKTELRKYASLEKKATQKSLDARVEEIKEKLTKVVEQKTPPPAQEQPAAPESMPPKQAETPAAVQGDPSSSGGAANRERHSCPRASFGDNIGRPC